MRKSGATKTWMELAFATSSLTVEIITKITGQRPRKVSDLYILEDQEYESIADETTEEFLRRMADPADKSAGPATDIHDLRIIILRANVVEVVPEGNLAKAAEGLAIEEQEREKEIYDIATEITLAQQYIDAARANGLSRVMTLPEALEYVRLRRNSGARELFARTGSNTDNSVTAAAVISDALYGRGAANDDVE